MAKVGGCEGEADVVFYTKLDRYQQLEEVDVENVVLKVILGATSLWCRRFSARNYRGPAQTRVLGVDSGKIMCPWMNEHCVRHE